MVTLRICGVTFRYGSVEALRDVTLEVREGEVVSIIGPNGAGKTTLLKCVLNLLKPVKGAVLIDPHGDVAKMRGVERAKLIAYTPQVEAPAAPLTVLEFVLLGRKPYVSRTYGKEDLRVAEEVLEELGLRDLALRRVSELSGGEWRKALIARALAQRPKVLLLDEPTNHLDLKHQVSVLELIRGLSRAKEVATLMAMHDVNLAIRYSDKIIALKKGTITYCGNPNGVTADLIEELYEVSVEVIRDSNGTPVIIPRTGAKQTCFQRRPS